MSRRRRAVLLLLATPFLLALIVVGLAFAATQTDFGRNQIRRQIEALVKQDDGLQLSLGRIDGNLLSSFRIQRIALSDAQGEWLIADDLSLSWSPLDLLERRLAIGEIKLSSLDLRREPLLSADAEENDPAASTSSTETALPALPVDVVLQSLEIERIRLDEALIGQEALFRLSLNLNAPSEDAVRSEVVLQQLAGGEASLTGLIEFHPTKQTLGVDVALAEPQGGLLAKMLELPGEPPVELTVLGDGPISAWQGQLLATAGDLLDADFLVTTRAQGTKIELDLQGSTRLAGLLPADLASLAAPRLDIESSLSWSNERQEITLSSALVQSAALRLNAEGSFRLPDESLTATAKIVPLDTTAIAPLIAPAKFKAAELDFALSGSLTELTAEADVQIEDLAATPDISVRRFVGSFQSTLSPAALEKLPITGHATVSDIAGLPDEPLALLGAQTDLDFDLILDLKSNRAELSKLEARGAGISVSGRGSVGIDNRALETEISLRLPDLTLVASVSGALTAKVALQSENFEQEIFADVKVTTQDLDPGDAQIRKLIGDALELEARISSTPDALTVTSLDLVTALGEVSASAELPTSFETIQAQFDAKVPTLANLNEITGVALKGQAVITGRISGAVEDPALVGSAFIEGLNVEETALGKLTSDYSVSGPASSPQGTVKSQLVHPQATMDLSTAFSLKNSTLLNLTGLELKLAENRITGDLAIPLDGKPVTGAIDGSIADLGQLTQFVDQSAAGSLDFKANLAGNGERQDARIALTVADLQLEDPGAGGPSLAKLNATVTARDLLGVPAFDLTAQAAGLRSGDFALDSLDLESHGTPETAKFGFALKNSASPAMTFKGSGQVTQSAETSELQLETLKGVFEERAIELAQTVLLRQSDKETRLESLKLRIESGEISASAVMSETKVNADLVIASLPLELLTLVDPQLATGGTLDGTVAFKHAAGVASGRFEFDAREVKPKGEDFAKLPPLSGNLKGDLSKGRLSFLGDVAGLQDTGIKVDGFLPINIALAPASAEISENQPLETNLSLRGDLAGLWPLLAIDEHLLAGKLSADVNATGSLASPDIKGVAGLSEGRYENLELGTLLTDLNFTANFEDAEKVILSLTAQDGDDGRLSAEGKIDLRDTANPGIDLSANLTKARLLRRDDILAQASGTLQLSGTANALNAKGEVVTDLVEINVGGALPPSIVDLSVEERNRPGNPGQASDDAANNQNTAPNSTVMVNLDLSLPRRVFIRGRGLDSEWSGRFKITGNANAPIIEGDLSPVRGDFTFAGKSFKLQKGKVSLAGGKDVDPDLDLSAVYEADELKAIVAITGTASSPEINLSSEPELPQDEILAQVLFGKSTGQLSPVEALQLAEAVASISGQLGSGEGIIGLVRKTVGVDVLTAGTNQESGEVEVRAGKYVTDDVFVGVTQGADPASTKVTVEVEVTPNISVESDVGQDASGRVGVFYKFDY